MIFFGHFRLPEVIETSTKPQFQPLSLHSKKVWANILSGAAVIERPIGSLKEKTRHKKVTLGRNFGILRENEEENDCQ